MLIVPPHNHCHSAHLDSVTVEMGRLGAPAIRAVDCGNGLWVALEGTHRLRAAQALGLTPNLVEVDYSDDVMMSELGGIDLQDDCTIAEYVDRRSGAQSCVRPLSFPGEPQ